MAKAEELREGKQHQNETLLSEVLAESLQELLKGGF